jgi:UDP-glucose 4-epimerase
MSIRVAWVTGARGFIGRRLTLELRGRGVSVFGIGHGHLPPDAWHAAGLDHWSNSEISAEGLGEIARKSGPPDAVFHLAGGSSVGASVQAPLEDFTRTTDTTARLLEWLRAHSPASKVVAASSAAVYGDTQGSPARESHVPSPVSPYGFHKLMMEQLCLEYSQVFGLHTTVLRMFSVYGEGLRKQLLWDCSVKLTSGAAAIELGGTGGELRDWIHVDDAAAAMARAAELADSGRPTYNLASGRAVCVRDIVSLLAKSLNRPVRIEFSGVSRPGDPMVLVADTERLAHTGTACAVSLESGIQRYAEWFMRSRHGR